MVSRETEPADGLPPIPAQLAARYPDSVAGLTAFAALLATEGVVRGLIGPREVPRLWERHLGNCAVVEQLVPASSSVADVGSGAGLPGLVLALVRPDLAVTLVEPMLRRTTFLEEAVASLGVGHVDVVRARAEELRGRSSFDVVTSRAVAPLEKLAAWCAPILRPGGVMLAMKGDRAQAELADAAGVLTRLGLGSGRIVEAGRGVVSPPATVVELTRSISTRRRRGSQGGDDGSATENGRSDSAADGGAG